MTRSLGVDGLNQQSQRKRVSANLLYYYWLITTKGNSVTKCFEVSPSKNGMLLHLYDEEEASGSLKG